MVREEKRAKKRAEEKQARDAERAARVPGPDTFRSMAEERPETPSEAARRIYRAGGEPQRRGTPERRSTDKPRKWREGHQ